MIDVSPHDRHGVTVVRVSGDIDLATAPRLRAALLDTDRQGRHRLQVDLRSVDFVDSTAIGVLIGALRRARMAGGDLVVSGLGPRPAQLFGLLGLDAVFQTGNDGFGVGDGPGTKSRAGKRP